MNTATAPDLSADLLDKIRLATSLLHRVATEFAPVVFANSLGAEDMVLTDLICREKVDIGIFSLDTGRLPAETYDLMSRLESHYGRKLDVYFPEFQAVEDYVREQGINGFYQSIESRKECCRIRKLEPLRRALAGKGAWVTGLRAAQSGTREGLELVAPDTTNGLVKVSPLAEWSEGDVWSFLRARNVPYNALHDRAYPSIGCAPCTRAIEPGEDIRAGRWWWETPETKECGLHMVNGKLQRIKAPGGNEA